MFDLGGFGGLWIYSVPACLGWIGDDGGFGVARQVLLDGLGGYLCLGALELRVLFGFLGSSFWLVCVVDWLGSLWVCII